MSKEVSQKKIVMISFIVDLLDVVTNLIVAIMTGSATIFSEMVQGIADSIGSMFLVIGQRRSHKKKSSEHPFGYSREVFFWSLLSAIVMLIIGGGLSLWRGIEQIISPQPLTSPYLAIIVISIAIITNGYAVSLSAKKLKSELGSFKAIFSDYSHPLVKGAFFRDFVGTTTSLLGLLAILAYELFELTFFDALGAIVSSILMLASSVFLILQARALITGQTLPKQDVERLKKIILQDESIEAINSLVAVYNGAHDILIEVDLDIKEDLTTVQIEKLFDQLELEVKADFPNLHRVRFLLNSPSDSEIKD